MRVAVYCRFLSVLGNHFLILAAVCAAWSTIPASRAGAAFIFTTVDYPSSPTTEINGISGSNIVGNYYMNDTKGFIYNGSTFTPLNDPLGSINSANGVSGSTVVGTYQKDANLGDSPTHGYIYDGSTFTTLDDPLATTDSNGIGGTTPRGISGNTVVGSFTIDEVVNGFIYNESTSTYTTLDDPLAGTIGNGTGTYATGICGSYIVGFYVDNNLVSHGFIYNSSTYTTLDDPLGVNGTGVLAARGFSSFPAAQA